jgi:Uma2 family endonuclease
MKACLCDVPQHLIQWRRQTGADMWDEMWEGVLHMPPVPNREHQDFQFSLEAWLRTFWARPGGNRVHHEINLASVGGWPHDYRIPDLLLLTPDRFGIDRNEYFEGPPTVVVEIRSPDDESYEKFPFYAKLGVPEVWVVDRDTKTPEVYLLVSDHYQKQPSGADGWIESPATAVQLRGEGGEKLALQMAADQATLRLLPED